MGVKNNLNLITSEVSGKRRCLCFGKVLLVMGRVALGVKYGSFHICGEQWEQGRRARWLWRVCIFEFGLAVGVEVEEARAPARGFENVC